MTLPSTRRAIRRDTSQSRSKWTTLATTVRNHDCSIRTSRATIVPAPPWVTVSSPRALADRAELDRHAVRRAPPDRALRHGDVGGAGLPDPALAQVDVRGGDRVDAALADRERLARDSPRRLDGECRAHRPGSARGRIRRGGRRAGRGVSGGPGRSSRSAPASRTRQRAVRLQLRGGRLRGGANRPLRARPRLRGHDLRAGLRRSLASRVDLGARKGVLARRPGFSGSAIGGSPTA